MTLMTVHRVSIAARKSMTRVADESVVLLAQMRTIFLQVLQAEYWNMIQTNKIPEGIPVARWLIDSCELALDNVNEPLCDFKYLAPKCNASLFIKREDRQAARGRRMSATMLNQVNNLTHPSIKNRVAAVVNYRAGKG